MALAMFSKRSIDTFFDQIVHVEHDGPLVWRSPRVPLWLALSVCSLPIQAKSVRNVGSSRESWGKVTHSTIFTFACRGPDSYILW